MPFLNLARSDLIGHVCGLQLIHVDHNRMIYLKNYSFHLLLKGKFWITAVSFLRQFVLRVFTLGSWFKNQLP